jgi:hypothetical protein
MGGLSAGLHVVMTATDTTSFTLAKATTVTTVEGSTDLITIADSTGFSIGTPVVFYSTTVGGLVAGDTYYILTVTTLGSGPSAQITVSRTFNGTRETLASGSGSFVMRGPQLTLTTSLPEVEPMTALPYNERMAIYQIAVDPVTTVVTLTLVGQTQTNDFVVISRGSQYRSAQLYRPTAPGLGLTRVSWLPVTTVVTEETIFDQGSVAFIEPVDLYNPGQTNDKYLVFPKTNILV